MAVRHYRLAVILATAALALASCGGGSGSGNVYAPPSTVGPMENVVVSAGGTNGQLAGGGTTSTSIAFPGATLGVGATLTLDA